MTKPPFVNGQTASASRIFFQSEVAALLGMPDTLVKSWTIGRPLRITPERSAAGSGTRNLYSVEDLYSFAIAKQLSMDGFASHAIQSILDALGNESASAIFAIASSGNGVTMPWKRWIKPKVKIVSPAQFEKEGWNLATDCANGSLGCYVLNIQGIVKAVDVRLASISVRGASTTRSTTRASEEPSRPRRKFLEDAE